MVSEEQTPFRYSPNKVSRYIMGKGASPDVLVAEYEDATVRDQGTGNWLRTPEAMLRAYSNDPEFFGNEDYRQGNGISIWTAEDEKRSPGHSVVGAVYDCDGDLALKRIMMNVVISTYNFGHGDMEYIGFVGRSDKDVAGDDHDGEEYDGWGSKDDFRIEKWRVSFARGEEE